MLVTSDWHLREESADTVFNEVIPGIIEACVRHGDFNAVCLGDLFHFRYKIPARILNILRDTIRESVETHGLTWRILPGNHDQYEVGGRNALEVLDDIKGVTVFTEPAWDAYGLWVPYRKRIEDLEAALALPDEFKARPATLAFLHHGVQGAWMNDSFQNTEGLTEASFSAFAHVFTGHYHKHHTVGRVTYIGSPYQTNAGESGQPKGYVHLNTDGSWAFFPQRWGRCFHRLTVDSTDINFDGIDPRDEVRIRTAAGVDPEKVAAQLVKAGIEKHVVTPEQEPLQARLDVPENSPLQHFAQAYVDAQETPLDKGKLMQIFGGLTQ